jgi:hypothetical protein
VINIGNLLKSSSYKDDIAKISCRLDCWTTTSFHGSFKNLGQTLPIGTQQDGTSCGVCVLNTLEHALLDTHLFTHGRWNVLRVQYFTDIVNLLFDRVSAITGGKGVFTVRNIALFTCFSLFFSLSFALTHIPLS